MLKGFMPSQEKLEALRWLLHRAAKKYQNPGILEMPLNFEDRGNENCFRKQFYITRWRWDLNPRKIFLPSHAFEACTFGHSDTPPRSTSIIL